MLPPKPSPSKLIFLMFNFLNSTCSPLPFLWYRKQNCPHTSQGACLGRPEARTLKNRAQSAPSSGPEGPAAGQPQDKTASQAAPTCSPPCGHSAGSSPLRGSGSRQSDRGPHTLGSSKGTCVCGSADGHRNCTGWAAASGTPGKSRKEHRESSSCRCHRPMAHRSQPSGFPRTWVRITPPPTILSSHSGYLDTPDLIKGVDTDTQASLPLTSLIRDSLALFPQRSVLP